MSAKIIGKMAEERYSRRQLAQAIGMPIGTLHNKLTGKTDWKLVEAVAVCDALKIPRVNIIDYFVV